MKVREIKIDGFGVWTGLALADLDDNGVAVRLADIGDQLADLSRRPEAVMEGVRPEGAVLWQPTEQEQHQRGSHRAGISSTGSGIEPAGVLKLRNNLPWAIETT